VHESRTAEALLHAVEGDAVIADKAYDSNAIRAQVKAAGMKAVIPSKLSRKKTLSAATKRSTASATASNAVSTKLKHFRRLATRYDRRVCHFHAFLCLAASMLWMRMSIQPSTKHADIVSRHCGTRISSIRFSASSIPRG
jgi:IS5 family transposase